jgi:hypothetical protein
MKAMKTALAFYDIKCRPWRNIFSLGIGSVFVFGIRLKSMGRSMFGKIGKHKGRFTAG